MGFKGAISVKLGYQKGQMLVTGAGVEITNRNKESQNKTCALTTNATQQIEKRYQKNRFKIHESDKFKTNLGLASSCTTRLATSKLAGETGRSRSKLKSIFNRSGRFLLVPDRARRAHERSKLPYDDVFRSRKLFSLADERKKSIKLLSSSSLSTRLRRRRKLPVGVISVNQN